MATEALVAAITGSGLVTAELSGQARVTSQVVEALASGGDVRVTSQIVEALASGGDVRVTSQIVEALASGGDVRVTSQIIEVVLPLISGPLAAAMTGSALVTASLLTPQPLAVTLNPTANVVALFDKNLTPATSTLSFTQSVSAFNQVPGNTILLVSTASLITVLGPTVSSLSGLEQTVDVDAVFYKSISTLIDLDQPITFAKALPVEFTGNVLTFTSTASAFNQTPSNTLVLTQVALAAASVPAATNSTLSFTHAAVAAIIPELSVSDALLLTQSVTTGNVLPKTATSTLAFTDLAFATVIESKCLVILQAPFDFLQTSIVLPCALFGDTENIVSEVSLRRSMNGGIQTHVKTNSNRRLNYTFRLLDRQKAVEVTEFFKYYNSDKIRLTNWKGEVWKVNLLTNPIDFVKTGKTATDVSLEFEGLQLNG